MDKKLFFEKYKTFNSSATHFNQDMNQYLIYKRKISRIKPVAQVSHFLVQTNILKDDIIKHCDEWKNNFSDLLLEVTTNLIEGFYQYIQINSLQAMTPPKNLTEMISFVEFRKRIVLEYDNKAKEFTLISDNVQVLEINNIRMPEVVQIKYEKLFHAWRVYKNTLEDAEIMLKRKKNEFLKLLKETQTNLKLKAKDLLQTFLETTPISTKWKSNDALMYTEQIQNKLEILKTEEKQLNDDLAVFEIQFIHSIEIKKLQEEILVLHSVWKLVNTWDEVWKNYKQELFWHVHVSDLKVTVNAFFDKFNTLVNELKNKKWEVIETTRNNIDEFRKLLPVIEDLKNPAMKDRHWDEVRNVINEKLIEKSSDFTLKKLVEVKIQDYSEQISDISKKSTIELDLDNAIQNIKEIWATKNLHLEPYKDKGIYYIKLNGDIFQLLEDHLVQLTTIKASKYISVFLNEADFLEKSLGLITEVLEIILSVQRQHIYLENIFMGDDIRQKMTIESIDYDILTEEWKEITIQIYKENNLFRACYSKSLFKHLNTMNYRLEVIQRALEVYMESKRHVFPRFYFISNCELLEILGNSKNPESIQPHLKKLFTNVRNIKFLTNNNQKKEAQGMFSKDKEYVDWNQSVICDGPAEIWLNSIEDAMRNCLKQILKQVKLALTKNLKTRDKWILEWPGQLCIVASQIQWTADCTRALVQSRHLKHKYPLKKMYKKQKNILTKLSKVIRSDLTSTERLKVVALIIIEIHGRDVIEYMYRSNCMDMSAFEWMCQLRFYCDKKSNDIVIRQTNTKQLYGYEYLGNSGRLVITPLTDRCYLTLTTAVHMHLGGNLNGSTYTGKTETIKDLGKHLAQFVIVVNCSKSLDYKSLCRIFLGLVQQGAWGCFDEIQRIQIEVLSSITQQISTIFSALAADLKTLVIENKIVTLVPTCGIFTTTFPNHENYSYLPDNFKSMFRSVSMIVPDSKLIVETILFSGGFKDAKTLGNKIFVLYSLCKQMLNKQNYYEYGLRSLIVLIKYAGNYKRTNAEVPDNEIILLAIHKTILTSINEEYLPIFTDMINNLFPDITPPEIKYEVLIDAIKRSMLKNNLQPTDSAVLKIVQLYEIKSYRSSVIIIGNSGAAKSTTWKILRDTFILLKSEQINSFETVIDYVLNPITLTIKELYGTYDHTSHEWVDGIFSSITRKICSDNGLEQKWVILDGPIDSYWIENMSSIMDDTKILILENGERILIPKQVSFIFEVEDLKVASPAIISRCGIIHNNHNDYGWRLYVDSWLNNCKFKLFKDEIKFNFEHYIDDLLMFKKLNCIEIITLTDQNCIISMCKLLESCTFHDLADKIPNELNDDQYKFLIKIWFIFCMIWSICGCVNEDGKKKIDIYIRKLEGVFPIRDTVYHYFVDTNYCKFQHWEQKLSINTPWKYDREVQFSKIIIPTVDTIRHDYLIQSYLSKKQPVLLVGPSGCGKTLNVKNSFETMNKTEYSFLKINMTSTTSSNDVKETIEDKLEKRTKELYIPLTGKTMVVFLDDMHMPIKEPCGVQPSLELIRHWIDYGFWYDTKKQCPKYVKNMLLICAMTQFDKIKHFISNRILNRFSVVNIPSLEENDIYKIYNSILNHHLNDFDETVSEIGNGLTSMTISLYKHLVISMTPTPSKMHYLFNLKDVSKVFQGLLLSNVKYQNFKVPMLRLWCHEVFRVFYDRLVDTSDQKWFLNQINHLLENTYHLTYQDLFASKKNPIFFSFLNEEMLYEEIVDEEDLKQFIKCSIKEYNSNSEFMPVDILLFRDYIEHICRIVRVISQPMGHILLIGIGGSGRSTLAKIASWLCKYSIFTIELSKSYGTSEFKEDLKLIYSETGIKNQPTSFVFNDTQIVDDSFLKIINSILSTGEVTRLFNENELEEIKNALSNNIKNADEIESAGTVYSIFIDRVKKNLHFILSFSPIEKSFRIRLKQYPALLNCTTIDWFLDWPKEALLEVASTSLDGLDILATITGEKRVHEEENETIARDKLKSSLSSIFSSIHNSVIEYSNHNKVELNCTNNVTPAVYLEMIFRYKKILHEKRIEKQNMSIKLRNGLQTINGINHKINDMTMELGKVTELITKHTKICEEMFTIISKYIKEIDNEKKEIYIISKNIKEDELKCQEMYNIALAELKLMIPELEEATNKVYALSKKDLSEMKCFSVPPEGVKLVLGAIMTLKQADPSWAEAKRQLNDPNFLQQLKDFDKNHVTDNVIKKIDVFIKNPEFELEKIGLQSTAAKSLGMWVVAIEKYVKMYNKTITPKRVAADLAMAKVKEEQTSLKDLEENLTKKQSLLEQQKLDYDENIIKKEQLITKAEELKNNLEKATKLIDGLSKERMKWNKTLNQIDKEFDYLPGDCILSTAFISYMGPFRFKSREIIMTLWLNLIKEHGTLNNPNFEVTLFLTNPTTIRNWNNHGLSNDRFSLENGIIVSQSYRYPFIIDPQSQAWRWIKNIELNNGLKIIDYRSTNNMQNLEIALQNGYPTLVQIDFENIDPLIISILSRSIIKQRNKLFIRIGNKLLAYNERFRLYITTKIKNYYHLSEIITRTTVIDFATTEEGLEEQLLKTLVNVENPGLEEFRDNTIINIEKDKKSLVDVQDELLKLLDNNECSLLENEQLLLTLKSSKATFNIIKERLQSSLTSQAEIFIAREGYRPCAKRAAILYFIINDLDRVNPMYQFSLDFYTELFKNSIKKSNAAEQLNERIDNLNEYHTYAVYENVCRGLFERHKLLFLFQICTKILIIENKINKDELEFLFNGGIKTNEKEIKQLITTKCPDWLPATCWDNILALCNLPSFYDVEKSFEKCSTEWYKWYLSPEPENLKLVGPWENKCNLFQRMLIIRSLRLDRLSFSIKHFVSRNLGRQFSETPVLDLKHTLNNLNNTNCLIFILSSGSDPTNILTYMNRNYNKKGQFQSLSLGNGQESIATDLIKIGQKEGHWIFLANCHLLLSWMPQLEKVIENMQDGKAHPDFKLWLSSKPHSKFPINLLQTAIKISTEQPKNIKSSLLHLYQNINEEQYSQNPASIKYKKILFNLCFFHSILTVRKKFLSLGWSKIYDFSDFDFEVSENILFNCLNEYEETPWTALKYLLGNVIYGGNITDIWDKRLLDTYINQFFNENSITTHFYKSSSLINCIVPENGTLQFFKDFIKTLPCEDVAETFGQHSNGDMIYLTRDNYLLCETLTSLQEQFNGSSVDNDKEKKVLFQISQIFQNIPSLINYEIIAENINIKRSILNAVIFQEAKCYNNLLKNMEITLMTLEKGITSLMIIPPDIENMFEKLYEGKVPDQWLKTYPSLMNLGAWMQNLIERVKYFTTLINTSQQPVSIWLGAFTSPASFLTCILLNESKESSVQIDLLSWEFIPMQTSVNDLIKPPDKGVYIHNLYLEGAGWDNEHLCLREPLPLELITKLPIIHFLPVEGKRSLLDFYQSPVYYCPKRSGTHETYSCAVILNLKSGSQHPDHWIKRSTAVLLNLGN
ncbi:dynein axonemal heavy chain 2-like [Rhopalosiphum padi]|uniref:dynein axonemal heavy chain 2-like n=1 Tax=Rhopalosiphum padi TaxID=40932 RepID=UPI00298D8CA5|nr:dynein axonemal heavy chain 2-like [Rhopalosiphum padi]